MSKEAKAVSDWMIDGAKQHSDLITTLKKVAKVVDRNFVRLQDRIDYLEERVRMLEV